MLICHCYARRYNQTSSSSTPPSSGRLLLRRNSQPPSMGTGVQPPILPMPASHTSIVFVPQVKSTRPKSILTLTMKARRREGTGERRRRKTEQSARSGGCEGTGEEFEEVFEEAEEQRHRPESGMFSTLFVGQHSFAHSSEYRLPSVRSWRWRRRKGRRGGKLRRR